MKWPRLAAFQLAAGVSEFNPHLIGVRTLTIYKDFFHKTISLIRSWGFNCPIVAGGPYATSNYDTLLNDKNIDACIIGEGEITFYEFITKFIQFENNLPPMKILKNIKGLAIKEKKDDTVKEVLFIDGSCDSVNKYSDNNLIIEDDPNSLIYIMFTSGSTGKPKGVIVEQHSVARRLIWMQNQYQFNEHDVALQKAVFSFDSSACELFRWLLSGGRISFLKPGEESNPCEILNTIVKDKVTIVDFVPSSLSMFIDYAIKTGRLNDLRNVRYIFTGVDRVTLSVVKKFNKYLNKKFGSRLINGYGPTEATIDVTHYDCSLERADGIVPIGKPHDHVKIYILDKFNKPLPKGERGELAIGGDCLARGYLNNKELTETKFIFNPYLNNQQMYKTGDMARILQDGNVEFLGRYDDQVKIHGFRIELQDVEKNILSFDKIDDCVVTTIDDGSEDKYLCAYYTSREAFPLDELKGHLKRQISHFMLPHFYIKLDKIPLTKNDKIDRKALPHPREFLKGKSELVNFINNVEKEIAQIWSKVLNIDHFVLSRESNFFDLGGHSLLAAIMLYELETALGCAITIQDLFKGPTIKDLASIIEPKVGGNIECIVPALKKEFYELSPAEGRLYFLHQLFPDNLFYNAPEVFRIKGNVAGLKERIKSSFQKITDKHEILRTSFHINDTRIVYQKIHDNAYPDIELFKSTGGAVDIKQVVNNFVRPFDLSQAPLFRVAIQEVSESELYLLWDIHHIIADGFSLEILIDDFNDAMEGFDISHPKLQYKDFTEWILKQKRTEVYKSKLNTWKDALSGATTEINLPCDYKLPDERTYKGDVLSLKISEDDYYSLKELAKEKKATLFMVLLSLYYLLLERVSSQKDLIVGTPVANRLHKEFESVVGMFVNTLPIRIQIGKNDGFEQILDQVRNSSIIMQDNQIVQLEDIVESLKIKRDINKNPLFNVAFSFDNKERTKSFVIPEHSIEYIPQITNTSKFDLSLLVKQYTDKLILDFEYSSELFSEETIERLANLYRNIISEVLGKPVSYIELLDKVLVQNESKIALVFHNRDYSYKQLNDKVEQLAYRLRAKGIRTDDGVLLLCDRSPELIIGLMGILKVGAVYIPADFGMPINRIRTIIEENNIHYVVSKEDVDNEKKILIHKILDELHNLEIIYIDSDSVISNNCRTHVEKYRSIWNYIADSKNEKINDYGWINSSGEKFAENEMNEFIDNVYHKLKDYIGYDKDVLEIGCGNGNIMYKIAPHVKRYIGTDLSEIAVKKNLEKIKSNGINNIEVYGISGDEIDKLTHKSFDIVIMSSVVQYFPNLNYFNSVINKVINIVKDNGIIFIGDVLDSDLKNVKKLELNNKFGNKEELHISRKYLNGLKREFRDICEVACFEKLGKIDNELKKYRFDAILTVKKIKKEPLHLCYIIYTSGSSGKPKGVMITNRSVINFCTSIQKRIPFCSSDKILVSTSVTFDIFVLEVLVPLLNGMTLVLADNEETDDPEKLLNIIMTHKITHAQFTPSRLNQLTSCPSFYEALSSVRHLLVGGEPFTKELFYNIEPIVSKTKVYNLYGPTEATIWATCADITSPSINIGTPLDNYKIYILDETNNVKSVDEIGEISIAGDGLSAGYLNDKELTRAKFINIDSISCEKIYKTGDMGKWTKEGNLEIYGRIDNQIKIRGHRIELMEVESIIKAHTKVKDCVVLLDNKTIGFEKIMAFVIPSSKTDEMELKTYLRMYLPEYMIPNKIHFCEKFPININGKLDKFKLMELANNSSEKNKTTDGGKNIVLSVSDRVKSIWGEILNIQLNGILLDDNFFNLGGHSLNATTLAFRLEKEFKRKISISSIFRNPTIRGQTSIIEKCIEPGENLSTNDKRTLMKTTHTQKGMLYMQSLNPDSTCTNFPEAFLIEEDIDERQLTQALKVLMERHELLRSSFMVKDNDIYYVIHDDVPFSVDVIYSKEENFNQTFKSVIVPFDLKKPPLIKLHLVKCDPSKNILIINAHHIILDGISVKSLAYELMLLLKGELLPKLESTFSGYSLWHNQMLESGGFTEMRDYWNNEMVGNIKPVIFKKDYDSQLFSGETFYHDFDSTITNLIYTIAQQNKATINQVILTAFSIFIFRKTQLEDFLIGIPFSGRTKALWQDTVGLFVNTLPIRIKIDGISTYQGLLTYIQDRLVSALENQDYPYGLIVQEHNKPFDILYMFINKSEQSFDNNSLFKPMGYEQEPLPHQLTLAAIESDSKISIRIGYNKLSFRKDSIRSFCSDISEIIKTMAGNLNTTVYFTKSAKTKCSNFKNVEFNMS